MTCACVDEDSTWCAAGRGGVDVERITDGERCECACHDYDPEESDYDEALAKAQAAGRPLEDR